jgi:hypothetical protein
MRMGIRALFVQRAVFYRFVERRCGDRLAVGLTATWNPAAAAGGVPVQPVPAIPATVGDRAIVGVPDAWGGRRNRGVDRRQPHHTDDPCKSENSDPHIIRPCDDARGGGLGATSHGDFDGGGFPSSYQVGLFIDP